MTKLMDVLAYLETEAAEGHTLRQTCRHLEMEEKWIAQFSKVLRGEKVGDKAIAQIHRAMRPDGVTGMRYYRPCLQRKYSAISAAHIEHMIDAFIRDNVGWTWTEMGFSTQIIKEE